ncbi:MAG TPA: pyridoxamine 5'-phosphate oxidase, partial [Thermomicrobiales bacterium]|nr:pyridoxamine 5'-phosphate oxidase [Thermomicrobiales bacterium]
MSNDLAMMRKNYTRDSLDERDVAANPFVQFATWLAQTEDTMSALEANAMALATVDSHGMPSARMVLLKGVDERGLVFYTNYESRKGRDIAGNEHVALLFSWQPLERQVRITGTASRIPEEESEAYFASRPEGSQIGAIASPQSEPVPDRAWLEERFERFAGHERPIERPANWGGFCVVP